MAWGQKHNHFAVVIVTTAIAMGLKLVAIVNLLML
ncbi:hypothetical protein SPLC1_S101640 [Arthrospira platensis C1]|nr:hypothetical protein SPLC1_S101640 [Arthrospira platensis C1]